MLATQVADCGWTGSPETSACQNESAGVIGHEGAPGTGLPFASAAPTSAATTNSRAQPIRGVGGHGRTVRWGLRAGYAPPG